MTIQDIEWLLTERRLEVYSNLLDEVEKKDVPDKDKFDSFLLLHDEYKRRADKCLMVLTENDFSDLDDFAAKRIIDSFAYATTLHLEADILLLKKARKYSYLVANMTKAVDDAIDREQKRLDSIRATFNEALQDFREQYTELLGNEQLILDSTLRKEFEGFL